MRKSVLIALAISPAIANAAEVVKFGPTLCGPGMRLSNGSCIEVSQDRCPAGYYLSNIESVTYSSPSLRMQCMNTYNKVEMPEWFHPIYNGVLAKFGPSLCAAGEHMSGGACVPRKQGACPDGFYRTVIPQNTFSAESISDQQCMNSYNHYEAPDYFSIIYNGILVNFGPKLCGDGKYLSDGVCTPHEQGDCPTNFYDVTGEMFVTTKDEEDNVTITKVNTLIKTENGTCAKGYSPFGLTQNCKEGVPGPMCAVLCDGDTYYTGVGTCAPLCAGGITQFRASNGWSVPVYATQQITPSLKVLTASGEMCYINALPGGEKGALNIQHAGKTYHIID